MAGKPVLSPDEQLIDIPTAAAMLSRCKRVTVRTLEAGGVPTRWLNGKRLYLRADVQAFIGRLTQGGPVQHSALWQPGQKVGAK